MSAQRQNERLARIEEKLDSLIKLFDKLSNENASLNGRVRQLEISAGAGKAAVGFGYKAVLALLAVGQIVNLVIMWAK